jgi:hypothetical protein
VTITNQWQRALDDHTLAGNLSRTDRAVAEAVRSFRRQGIANPTQAAIARRAGCSDRQVRRSLVQLRHVSIVAWDAEHVPMGCRRRQIANRYRLLNPWRQVLTGQRLRRKTQGGPKGPANKERTDSSFTSNRARAPETRRLAENKMANRKAAPLPEERWAAQAALAAVAERRRRLIDLPAANRAAPEETSLEAIRQRRQEALGFGNKPAQQGLAVYEPRQGGDHVQQQQRRHDVQIGLADVRDKRKKELGL